MLRIVVADDEQLIRTSVLIALDQIDIEATVVAQASNGANALELVKQHKPDILITDIKMPILNGLELTKLIRKENIEVFVIIISGFADFNYAKEAIKYGVNGYVLKPINPKDMKEAIDNIIQEKEKQHELAKEYAQDIDEKQENSNDIIEYINKNYASDISLITLSREFNFNPKYLSALIKSKVHKSFTELIVELRINRAIKLIHNTDMSIKEIALQVGYTDHQYFHRVFKRYTGKTPLECKKRKVI